ncbi:uncharacterized protein LOC111040008 [Myzus persicae]|uniref:uncharacterized protein LOC111040008 n=1 Tax=Myzus persicae TaxID=13164 RepID=UPI000B93402B|nr:uncharacterized protein LOC111040008 [Myzus persicae]
MPKCIMCSNDSLKTRGTLPRVVYHSFPKNPLRKNTWLRAIGIDHCDDGQRICSDHFSIEDYRPSIKKRILNRNVVPLPFNRKFVENCLPYSSIAQSNKNIQIENNKYVPIRQNLLRKERIKNHYASPRRSSRQIKLTTTNENMIYENVPKIRTELFEKQISTVTKTDVVPLSTSTKDYTLGKGPRCSVKNCFNRRSKNLSLFAYPSDFVLRKMWIEKCGLEVASAGKLKTYKKVCCIHFDQDCFKNIEKKNRLRRGAVPSLFLGNDKIKARNIPSTSLTDNSGSAHVNKPTCSSSNCSANVNSRSTYNSGSVLVNKPSCSSSNYGANVNSRSTYNSGSVHINKPSCSSSNYVAHMNNGEIIPLLVYIDSTTRKTKDFEPYCCVSGCITNNDEDIDEVTFFAPPMGCVHKWSSSLGLQLTVNSILCEKHFRPQDILYPVLLVNGKNKIVKSLVPDCLPVPVNDQFSTKKINNVPGV